MSLDKGAEGEGIVDAVAHARAGARAAILAGARETGLLRVIAITRRASELQAAAGPTAIVERVESPAEALAAMAQMRPSIVLVDEVFFEGPALVAALKDAHPCVVVALVEEPLPESISRALANGADTVSLRHPAQLRRLLAQESSWPPRVTRPMEMPGELVGSSPAMQEVWRLALLASRADVSVLVTGETGAGKEIVARALHRLSARRDGPFVAVNCAALPEALLESELFGHEKGSFTGAATRHRGRFEIADGGTLFLDEIGDLPANLQAKLLRVLQEHTFERVGGTDAIAVDVRVLAATHRDLQAEIARGGFRSDLFYRLNVLSIDVPPLRQRKADVLALWEHFVHEGARHQRTRRLETSTAVRRRLIRHDWPGNVRELYNAAQHVMTVATGSEISVGELPTYLRTESNAGAAAQLVGVGMTMKDVERTMIQETYRLAGTVKATAEMLGISVRTVHYRLREYKSQDGTGALGSDGLPKGDRRAAKSRVLIAEDDDDLRIALADFLRGEGYDVTAVADGDTLLKHVGAALLVDRDDALPELVISDLRMPGATGLQFLEGIRAQGSRIPVVLMTAFGDTDIRERARSLGATAFLDKPIDLTALEGVIRQVLS